MGRYGDSWGRGDIIPTYAKIHRILDQNGRWVYGCDKCTELYPSYKLLKKHKSLRHSY